MSGIEITSIWIDEWGDYIELPPYVCRGGGHGVAHRLFDREGTR